MNPFAGYGNSVHGDRFIGRVRIRTLAAERLAAGAGSISFVGLPRVGKTSLTNAVLADLPRLNPRGVVVRVNLGALPRDQVGLFRALVEHVVERIEEVDESALPKLRRVLAESSEDAHGSWRRFERLLKRLKADGWTTVVAIDEFDAVKDVVDAPTFIQRLRELIDRRSETAFCALFASRRSLFALESRIAGVSTLHGVCEHHRVRPFDQEELALLVARAPPELGASSSLLEAVWSLTGGHPWLSEMLLCHAVETGSLAVGFERCRAEFVEFYDHIRLLLSEDALFKPLVQLTVGPAWDIEPRAPERLRAYGVVRVAGEFPDTESFRGWSDHFQDYLERVAREAPAWELWAETERALRDLVETRLAARDGTEWLAAFEARHRYSETVDSWRATREKDRRQFGVMATERLLDYAYPAEVTAMIFKEWSLFGPVLGKPKEYWHARFDALARFRNPQAHNRQVPVAVVTQAQGICREVLERLKDLPL